MSEKKHSQYTNKQVKYYGTMLLLYVAHLIINASESRNTMYVPGPYLAFNLSHSPCAVILYLLVKFYICLYIQSWLKRAVCSYNILIKDMLTSFFCFIHKYFCISKSKELIFLNIIIPLSHLKN